VVPLLIMTQAGGIDYQGATAIALVMLILFVYDALHDQSAATLERSRAHATG